MNDPVITAQGLTRRFDGFTAVDGVSFEVDKAAIFGLLGPNGSGKSTIIRMLCGVLPPSAGTATVLDIDINKDPEGIKRHIGYMSQNFSLYGDLSVDENLDFYGRIYGLKGAHRRERRDRVVELTGIEPYADRLAAELSGGWKQRLALAACVMHHPDLLMLDEPTAGVSPIVMDDLFDRILEIASTGIAILMVEQNARHALEIADHGFVLVQGSNRFTDTGQNLLADPEVRRSFLGG